MLMAICDMATGGNSLFTMKCADSVITTLAYSGWTSQSALAAGQPERLTAKVQVQAHLLFRGKSPLSHPYIPIIICMKADRPVAMLHCVLVFIHYYIR